MNSASIGPEGLDGLRSLEDAHFPEGSSPDHPDLVSAKLLFGGRFNSAGVSHGRAGEGAATVIFDFSDGDSRDQDFDEC